MRRSQVLTLEKQLTASGVIVPRTALLQHIETEEGVGLPDAFVDAASESVLGANGPLWYQGTAGCRPLIEGPRLTSYSSRLVTTRRAPCRRGSHPDAEARGGMRLQGKVYVIDTGMLNSVYRGNSRALELTSEGIRVLTQAGLGELTNTLAIVSFTVFRCRRVAILLCSSGRVNHGRVSLD